MRGRESSVLFCLLTVLTTINGGALGHERGKLQDICISFSMRSGPHCKPFQNGKISRSCFVLWLGFFRSAGYANDLLSCVVRVFLVKHRLCWLGRVEPFHGDGKTLYLSRAVQAARRNFDREMGWSYHEFGFCRC